MTLPSGLFEDVESCTCSSRHPDTISLIHEQGQTVLRQKTMENHDSGFDSNEAD